MQVVPFARLMSQTDDEPPVLAFVMSLQVPRRQSVSVVQLGTQMGLQVTPLQAAFTHANPEPQSALLAHVSVQKPMLFLVENEETSTALQQLPDSQPAVDRHRSPRSPCAIVALQPGEEHAQ